jgi:hypothetical protein
MNMKKSFSLSTGSNAPGFLEHADALPVSACPFVNHNPVNLGVKRIITAYTYIDSRVDSCAKLAH